MNDVPSIRLFTGYAYYGEYPLAFAASFGNEDIYDYLLEHGADPNLKDVFGNTVLHLMVIANQTVSIIISDACFILGKYA
jgi:hypothetical protein